MDTNRFLRKDVGVTVEDGAVVVRSPLWEASLPRDWVEERPRLWSLLERRSGERDLRGSGDGSEHVLQLLERMGCLGLPGDRSTYTLRELKLVFEPLCDEWYARYYSHPLWTRLREGSLSRNGLLAWLIHNYHISRAAGITDARCATRFTRPDLRTFFRTNALEEYWHCEAFYFVQHPNLSVSNEDVKSYVPLPSTLAFEQHALRTAEDDWLANVMLSFFQESSIKFYADCLDFYARVEKNYGIPGFFDSWKAHMQLDFEFSHAGVLEALLESDESIDREAALRSLRNAWLGFGFLMSSLDEAVDCDRTDGSVLLRGPVRGGVIDPGATALADGYGLDRPVALEASQSLELYARMGEAGIGTPEGLDTAAVGRLSEPDRRFLGGALRDQFFKALSYAASHDEAILFGRLADHAVKIGGAEEQPLQPGATWVVAVANCLHEAAVRPPEFAFLLYHLLELARHASAGDAWLPVAPEERSHLETYLRSRAITPREADRLATLLLQFNELLALSAGEPVNALEVDFFRV